METKEKELTSSDESGYVITDDDDELSKIISQLETFKGDDRLEQLDPPTDDVDPSLVIKTTTSEIANDDGIAQDERIEIIKELKEIKRQNFITQCLVSAMIVITVAWQLSEVTLVLKMKDGVTHPFRSFSTMLQGVFKKRIGQNGEKNNSGNLHEDEGPSIKIPDIPNLGFKSDDNQE